MFETSPFSHTFLAILALTRHPPLPPQVRFSSLRLSSETVLRLVDNTLFPLTSAPASEYKRYHFGLGTQCPTVTTNKTPAETM